MHLFNIVFAFSFLFLAHPAFSQTEVDMMIVIAVDVSGSVDDAEYQTQKEGIVKALQDPQVRSALEQCNMLGAALTYVEWTGVNGSAELPRQLVPWRRVKNTADLQSFAAEVLASPPVKRAGTDIEGALVLSGNLLENNTEFNSERKTILISGDGEQNVDRGSAAGVIMGGPMANQSGLHQALQRTSRELAARKIHITGLVILNDTDVKSGTSLDRYFEENIVGPSGGFVLPIQDFSDYSNGLVEILLRLTNNCIA